MTALAHVRLLGAGLRTLCGGRELCVKAGGVGELLEALAARGGAALARQIFADPEAEQRALHRDLVVLVNGRDVRFLSGLDTSLGASDAVTLHVAGARSFPGG